MNQREKEIDAIEEALINAGFDQPDGCPDGEWRKFVEGELDAASCGCGGICGACAEHREHHKRLFA